jgi:hypothetical protein
LTIDTGIRPSAFLKKQFSLGRRTVTVTLARYSCGVVGALPVAEARGLIFLLLSKTAFAILRMGLL